MTTMTIQPDGSIVFSAPVSYVSQNYSQDPENPCRYIPKYEPCKFRSLEVLTLKCGKQSVNWNCSLLDRGVSVPICRACTKRELPDEKSG